MVAYAPTEKAPEGQKVKYIAALNCIVASVPAREYVFGLTDANARTGKRGEGGREADSKVMDAYGRDKLNENGKLLLGFAEDNNLALLSTFSCTPKGGVMLSTADEFVPRSKRPRGAQGWFAGPDKKAQMNAAWQQIGEARRHLHAEPHNSSLRKVMNMAGKKLRKVRKAAVLSFFWDFVHKLETRTRERDQAGSYKHLKTMNLEGK